MKTILLCGYGWFASIPEGQVNNAELVARALDGEIIQGSGGHCAVVRSLIVPVIWKEAFAPVERAIADWSPELVLAVGTDASAGAMRPEPYAVNYMRGADAARDGSVTTMDAPIVPGGEEVLRGTLPFDAMTRAMLSAGVPAQTGALTDAPQDYPTANRSTTGLYLCNYMAYRLALLAKTMPPMRTGFLHIPTQPAYACAQRLAAAESDAAALSRPMAGGMPLEQMIAGTREALRACIDAL